MNVVELLAPWLLALGLLIPMRSLERWLHQHIFKVGWLLTKNLQTTTILYYTFFLPGVFLHEVIVWLMAGILNIRASGDFKFPEKQEIAELKLNFVKYDAKKIGIFRLFIINLMPLVGGIAFIWFAINNPLNMSGFFALLAGEPNSTLGDAVQLLIASPDFLLWMYLVFAVSATMTPDPSNLRGWRLLLPPIVIAIIAFYALGIGDRVLGNALSSISQGASVLTGIFLSIIGINLSITAVLGGTESIIERVTGNSATFEKGKLVAVRREEIIKMRAEQAEKARKAAQRQQSDAVRAAAAGPPSIYRLQLPIPVAPDKDSALLGEAIGQGALPSFVGASALPVPGTRPALTEPMTTASVPTTTLNDGRTTAASLQNTSVTPPAVRPASATAPLLNPSIDQDEDEIDDDQDEDEIDDVDDDDPVIATATNESAAIDDEAV